MLDGSLFEFYMLLWFVFWMFDAPMGRILEVILPDVSLFTCCMARWAAFWMLYAAI